MEGAEVGIDTTPMTDGLNKVSDEFKTSDLTALNPAGWTQPWRLKPTSDCRNTNETLDNASNVHVEPLPGVGRRSSAR